MKLKLTYEFNGLKIEGVTETQNDICEFAKQCKIACGEFITKDLLKATQSEKIRMATDKQKKLLTKLHIEYNENITAREASDLIDQHYGNKSVDELEDQPQTDTKPAKPASDKQIQLLINLGAKIPENLTSTEASALIDKIKSIK